MPHRLSSHHPLISLSPLRSEARVLGDPGALPSCVCVCVCVLQTGSVRFQPPLRSSCGADPPTQRVPPPSPPHTSPQRQTDSQMACFHSTPDSWLYYTGTGFKWGGAGPRNRPMAENTDPGMMLVGLLTKWTWHPNEGRHRGLFNMWLNGTLKWESESEPAPQRRHNQGRMTTG